MQIITFIFAVVLGVGSIYWFGSCNPLEEIAEEIIEKKIDIEKELDK